MSADIVARDAGLMSLWPERPYEFGDQLGLAARALIVPTSPLRDDTAFVEDVMLAILHRARKQGVVFEPEVDTVITNTGAHHAVEQECCVGDDYCDLDSSPLAPEPATTPQ